MSVKFKSLLEDVLKGTTHLRKMGGVSGHTNRVMTLELELPLNGATETNHEDEM